MTAILSSCKRVSYARHSIGSESYSPLLKDSKIRMWHKSPCLHSYLVILSISLYLEILSKIISGVWQGWSIRMAKELVSIAKCDYFSSIVANPPLSRPPTVLHPSLMHILIFLHLFGRPAIMLSGAKCMAKVGCAALLCYTNKI